MEQIKLEEFNIIGIMTIADNFENLYKVGQLWEDFFKDNLIEKIPSKADDKIYAVYTDYESDEKGKFNFIIGCKVDKKIIFVPDGMVLKNIKSSNYMIFKGNGIIKEKLPLMWQKIWNTKLDRKYIADFEIYNVKNMMTENAEIKIYLGIK